MCSATNPLAHSSNRAKACLHGSARLGQLQRKPTATWSTTHSYGSALVPVHRPHTACALHPVPTQRDDTASGRAAATDDGLGASASTCSTCHLPSCALTTTP